MEQLPKRLDGRNHAGHDIRQVQHALDFGLDAIPNAGGKYAQELAIETCVNSQTFGDGKNHLSVRNGKTNICGDVDACHKRAFWVAGDAAKGSGAIHVNIAHETKSPSPLCGRAACLGYQCGITWNGCRATITTASYLESPLAP